MGEIISFKTPEVQSQQNEHDLGESIPDFSKIPFGQLAQIIRLTTINIAQIERKKINDPDLQERLKQTLEKAREAIFNKKFLLNGETVTLDSVDVVEDGTLVYIFSNEENKQIINGNTNNVLFTDDDLAKFNVKEEAKKEEKDEEKDKPAIEESDDYGGDDETHEEAEKSEQESETAASAIIGDTISAEALTEEKAFVPIKKTILKMEKALREVLEGWNEPYHLRYNKPLERFIVFKGNQTVIPEFALNEELSRRIFELSGLTLLELPNEMFTSYEPKQEYINGQFMEFKNQMAA